MAKQPLTPERIIDAAARVADTGGLAGVSMRNVARELGVEAMSLYHHIPGKDGLLDALSEWVFSQIELPRPDDDWRTGATRDARSFRDILAAHPWALTLVGSRRNSGPAILGHLEAMLACLRRDGFSVRLAAHAVSLLDAYVYGFVLNEQNLPMEGDETPGDFAAQLAPPVELYPNLIELVTDVVSARDYRYADEFDPGLELILDGLAARRASLAD